MKSFDVVTDKNLSMTCRHFTEKRHYSKGRKGKGLFACIYTSEVLFLVLNFRKYVDILLLIMKIFYFL